MISIVPGSGHIKITRRPTVLTPTVSGPDMFFGSTSIQATGSVRFHGAAGDVGTGWTVGFLQAQWIETNWIHYRGRTNADGSLFLQRARPPARPAQACRDTVGPVSDIFYNISGGSMHATPLAASPTFPLTVTALHYDEPADSAPLIDINTLTSQPNYLHEAQFEFHFCTVLVVQDNTGAFTQLAHFYWNEHWQATFEPVFSHASSSPASWHIHRHPTGNGAHVGHVTRGAATDTRFAGVLTSSQSSNCNTVFGNAVASPNRTESLVWRNYDVTQ